MYYFYFKIMVPNLTKTTITNVFMVIDLFLKQHTPNYNSVKYAHHTTHPLSHNCRLSLKSMFGWLSSNNKNVKQLI